MAHVFGHGDFFKNNYMFSHTNRPHDGRGRTTPPGCAASSIANGVDQDRGISSIRCLSLENLIDYHAPSSSGNRARSPRRNRRPARVRSRCGASPPTRVHARLLNPKEFIEGERRRLEPSGASETLFPSIPRRDILLFLTDNAPARTLGARDPRHATREAYYFAPQGQTKIMNEGWASYWPRPS